MIKTSKYWQKQTKVGGKPVKSLNSVKKDNGMENTY